MINKVDSGSVNSKYTPKLRQQPTFNGGLGRFARNLIQTCEEKPMVNVAVLDCTTAIFPRSILETVIGSKQKDEDGNVTDRKFNFLAGFEALRREGSGLIINCLIPGFIVAGAANLLKHPVMGNFKASNLTKSWANSDAINTISDYYTKSEAGTKEARVYNTLKSMFTDLEGVDGDISKGGLKRFAEVFANDAEFDARLKSTVDNILSDKPQKGYADDLYRYMIEKTGASENLRFSGKTSFISSNLKHLCASACEILHGANQEGIINSGTEHADFSKYVSKAKKLVNAKSIAGLGIVIPLAIAAQPINRWITHKIAGQKGAPIYNDDQERILTPSEKAKLRAEKFLAVPAMLGVTALSMLMDRPSLKMFQFKNILPTMDQARIVSAATFSSRIAASEDSNELKENTIRDIATFSSFYFLGDYAAKGVATVIEKYNKFGIKLTNTIKPLKENAGVLSRFWHWAKHTKIKSTDELSAIANPIIREKAKTMRSYCQLGNLLFSLLALGVFIPLYTRTQTNKKKQAQIERAARMQSSAVTFTQNSQTFKSFFS